MLHRGKAAAGKHGAQGGRGKRKTLTQKVAEGFNKHSGEAAERAAKSAHARNLPPSWMTVYELTKAPDEALKGWLADVTIHPEMDRKDALSEPTPRT